MNGDAPVAQTVLELHSAIRLDNKVVWVTGASRGLGRAIAVGLARAGAAVALTARTHHALDEVRHTIEDAGGAALVVAASVTSTADVRAACGEVLGRWGRIDVLVNNAGISPSFKPSVSLLEDEWRRILDVNLTGAYHCAMAAGSAMVEAGGGSIVNVSSVHGSVGASRLLAYSVSKGGLDALTRSLAVEWAPHGVRVNAIAPGYFETGMTRWLREQQPWRDQLLDKIPLGRFGAPDELLPAVAYLASDLASYVTGSTLVVDGGWTAQ